MYILLEMGKLLLKTKFYTKNYLQKIVSIFKRFSNTISVFFDKGTWVGRSTHFLIVNGVFITLFIAICVHHRAFSQQFQHKTESLDIKSLYYLIQIDLTAKE